MYKRRFLCQKVKECDSGDVGEACFSPQSRTVQHNFWFLMYKQTSRTLLKRFDAVNFSSSSTVGIVAGSSAMEHLIL